MDYVLNKLDELQERIGELERENAALREKVKEHRRFTGASDWQEGRNSIGDLAGHLSQVRGRVTHLEEQTGIDTDDLPEEELCRLEGLSV